MKSRTDILTVKPLIILLLVALLAALAPLSLHSGSATYAQTETSAALPAPTLTAQTGEGVVELRWTQVAGPARYELWGWWDGDTGRQRLDDAGLTGTPYPHEGLTVGSTYYSTIRAVDAAGETSAWLLEYPYATVPDSLAIPDASGEKAALVALYEATNGANWTQSDNWLSEQPIATWYGVVTDERGHLTELRLSNTGLSGPITDLNALTNLTNLDLSHNQLRGPIPDLSPLTNLTNLDLSHNQLSGPIPDLSLLTNLTSLNLASNGLSGPITDLSPLANLAILNLSSNQLSGPIPDLSSLTNLTNLNLASNGLSGPIPDLSPLNWLELRFRIARFASGLRSVIGPLNPLEARFRLVRLVSRLRSGIGPLNWL